MALAQAGADSVLVARRREDLRETQAAVQAAGRRAWIVAGDVTDQKSVQDAVAETVKQFGRLDILINNAGILRDKTFRKMELDDFELVVDVHLLGSVYCTKAAWPVMLEQGYGRILMTTSSSGLYGNFGQSNYGAAKLGLVGFMNTLKLEGGKSNIRVNTIEPVAATRMT